MPIEYLQEHSPIRSVSVSADTRYLSIAGRTGFAHLSATSGRWRVLNPFEGPPSDPASNFEDIPQVRGGMCWYGNVLMVGADFGDSHEVQLLSLYFLLSRSGAALSPECNKYGADFVASSRDLHFFNPVNVPCCGFFACILPGQHSLPFCCGSVHGEWERPVPSKACPIWSNQFPRDHSFSN